MKKILIFLVICAAILPQFGCAPKAAPKSSDPFTISGMSSGLGSTSNDNLDESKYSYTISLISGQKEITEVKTVKIAAGEKLAGKVTEQKDPAITPKEGFLEIKGTMLFDSKGLTKEQIVALEPYIKALIITCTDGKEYSVPLTFAR